MVRSCSSNGFSFHWHFTPAGTKTVFPRKEWLPCSLELVVDFSWHGNHQRIRLQAKMTPHYMNLDTTEHLARLWTHHTKFFALVKAPFTQDAEVLANDIKEIKEHIVANLLPCPASTGPPCTAGEQETKAPNYNRNERWPTFCHNCTRILISVYGSRIPSGVSVTKDREQGHT